jgi:hypothetical protein
VSALRDASTPRTEHPELPKRGEPPLAFHCTIDDSTLSVPMQQRPLTRWRRWRRRSTAAAERFVDVLGLKSVFAAFMGKITRTSVRKLEPDEKADEETRAVSVLASLFTGTSFCVGEDRAR